jgi:signal transduction histidine kinase
LINLVTEANGAENLHLHLENKLQKNVKLDNKKKLTIYRIAQEQLNNIRKYSRAKRAVLSLNKDSRNIIFSISDDGIGFDPKKTSQGIGLRNIKSRVEFYAGKMALVTAPGKGCRLEVMLPV